MIPVTKCCLAGDGPRSLSHPLHQWLISIHGLERRDVSSFVHATLKMQCLERHGSDSEGVEWRGSVGFDMMAGVKQIL